MLGNDCGKGVVLGSFAAGEPPIPQPFRILIGEVFVNFMAERMPEFVGPGEIQECPIADVAQPF